MAAAPLHAASVAGLDAVEQQLSKPAGGRHLLAAGAPAPLAAAPLPAASIAGLDVVEQQLTKPAGGRHLLAAAKRTIIRRPATMAGAPAPAATMAESMRPLVRHDGVYGSIQYCADVAAVG